MRACKSGLWKAKKYREQELRDRVIYLQKEVEKLFEIVREQEHRIVQLELAKRLGN